VSAESTPIVVSVNSGGGGEGGGGGVAGGNGGEGGDGIEGGENGTGGKRGGLGVVVVTDDDAFNNAETPIPARDDSANPTIKIPNAARQHCRLQNRNTPTTLSSSSSESESESNPSTFLPIAGVGGRFL